MLLKTNNQTGYANVGDDNVPGNCLIPENEQHQNYYQNKHFLEENFFVLFHRFRIAIKFSLPRGNSQNVLIIQLIASHTVINIFYANILFTLSPFTSDKIDCRRKPTLGKHFYKLKILLGTFLMIEIAERFVSREKLRN